MYPKEFFLEQFRDDESEYLIARLATADLTDAARNAIQEILSSRGVSKSSIQSIGLQARKERHRQTRGEAVCDYCGNAARFRYVMDEGQRFCNKTCLRDARLMELSEDIDPADIERHAQEIRHSPCPICKKHNGIVETRWYYRVWSAVAFTRWTKSKRVCCKSCGTRQNLKSIGFSLAFGWWGFPWGLLMTPVQIVSNLGEIFRSDDRSNISDALRMAARLNLANQRLSRAR